MFVYWDCVSKCLYIGIMSASVCILGLCQQVFVYWDYVSKCLYIGIMSASVCILGLCQQVFVYWDYVSKCLYIGIMSASLKDSGNNCSAFESMQIIRDNVAFFVSNCSISFGNSSWVVKMKEIGDVFSDLQDAGVHFIFFTMFSMAFLGLIVFSVVSGKDSMSKSSMVSMKKLLIFSATSFSLVITSLFSFKINSFCLSEKSGLTLNQDCNNNFSFLFEGDLHKSSFVFYEVVCFLLWEIYYIYFLCYFFS